MSSPETGWIPGQVQYRLAAGRRQPVFNPRLAAQQ